MEEEGLTAKDAKVRQGAPREDVVARAIIKSALDVHTALGPGLRQLLLPIKYDGVELDAGYRLDLLVDDCVVAELKTVERIAPIHMAQLLSHLQLGRFKLGLLLNFHVLHMRDGIKRVANGM